MEPISKVNGPSRYVAVALLLLMSACSGEEGEALGPDGKNEDSTATTEDALFDASTIDGTAKLALPGAGSLSVLSAFDPLGTGRQVEYCGLIMRKSNGTFHASLPVTANPPQEKFCSTTITPPAGSKVVGFYHSHTPVSVPGFSPLDIQESERTGRVYYVVSTVTKCGQKYDPATNRTTSVGCFVF